MKKYLFFLLVFLLAACAAGTDGSVATQTLAEPTDTPRPEKPTRIPTQQPSPTAQATNVPENGALVWVADLPGEDVVPGEFGGLIAQPDGSLWLRTSIALARFEPPGTWKVIVKAPKGEEILGMDGMGRVYASSEAAPTISVWQNGEWMVYGEAEGWKPVETIFIYDWAVPVRRLLDNQEGQTWLETAQDVRLFNGQSWRVFSAEEMGMSLPVPGEYSYPEFQLLFDPGSGAVWAGECDWGGPGPFGGAGVRRYLNGVWEGADWALNSVCVTDMALAQDGALWAGSLTGIWRFDPLTQDWINLGAPEPPEDSRSGYAMELAPLSGDEAWVLYAFCGGASCGYPEVLYYFNDGVWTMLSDPATPYPIYMVTKPGNERVYLVEQQLSLLNAGRKEPLSDLFVLDWAPPYWVVVGDGQIESVWREK